MKITKELHKSGIYCIINIKNNKKYIGSSKNIYQRLSSHRSYLRSNSHGNRKLQNSWNKHGELLFDYYVYEFCDEELLINREQFYIDTIKPEYNITLFVERNIRHPESILLQSETLKRKYKSGELVSNLNKKISKYTLEGVYIKSYKSMKIAAKENNIASSTISRYLNGTYKKGGGFLWSYKNESFIDPYVKKCARKPKLSKNIQVLKYNTQDIIFEFNSLRDCAEYFKTFRSSISHAIKVKQCFKKEYMIVFKSA